MASIDQDMDVMELDKLIKNLEFENHQFVKQIEKEKQHIEAVENEVDKKQTETVQLQESTAYFDQETKRLHRQFQINRDNVDSLRKTSDVLSDQETAMRKKLEMTILKTEQEKVEHSNLLQHYRNIWDDYHATYMRLKRVVVLQKKKNELADYQRDAEKRKEKKEELTSKLKHLKGAEDFKPFEDVDSFVIKMAELYVGTTQTNSEIKKVQEDIAAAKLKQKELANKIAKMKDLKIQRELSQQLEEAARKAASQQPVPMLITTQNDSQQQHGVTQTDSEIQGSEMDMQVEEATDQHQQYPQEQVQQQQFIQHHQQMMQQQKEQQQRMSMQQQQIQQQHIQQQIEQREQLQVRQQISYQQEQQRHQIQQQQQQQQQIQQQQQRQQQHLAHKQLSQIQQRQQQQLVQQHERQQHLQLMQPRQQQQSLQPAGQQSHSQRPVGQSWTGPSGSLIGPMKMAGFAQLAISPMSQTRRKSPPKIMIPQSPQSRFTATGARAPQLGGSSLGSHMLGTTASRHAAVPQATPTYIRAPQPMTSMDFQAPQPTTSAYFQAPQPMTSTDFQAPQPMTSADFQAPQPMTSADFQVPQPMTSTDFQAPQPMTSADFQAPQPMTSADFQVPQSMTFADFQARQPTTSYNQSVPQAPLIQAPHRSTAANTLPQVHNRSGLQPPAREAYSAGLQPPVRSPAIRQQARLPGTQAPATVGLGRATTPVQKAAMIGHAQTTPSLFGSVNMTPGETTYTHSLTSSATPSMISSEVETPGHMTASLLSSGDDAQVSSGATRPKTPTHIRSDRPVMSTKTPPNRLAKAASEAISPFDRDKHLARVREINSKSPGFRIASRPMYQATSEQNLQEPDQGVMENSQFFQPFFSTNTFVNNGNNGGGDASTKTTLDGSTRMQPPASLFGDSNRNTSQQTTDKGFLIPQDRSAPGATGESFSFSSGAGDASTSSVFSMFGDSQIPSPEQNQSQDFSFSFGGANSPPNAGGGTGFNLFS